MSSTPISNRMPLGYGDVPGPRLKLSTRTNHKLLTSYLPAPCFNINLNDLSDTRSYASIIFTQVENLPWLAGRGYSHCGLYIHDVTCQGVTESVRGRYLSVLFENMADPLLTGREELGYAKVFASLDTQRASTSVSHQIGWGGKDFGEIQLSNIRTLTSSEELAYAKLTASSGLLHFKAIPRTGCPGEYDAYYPTFSPAPPVNTTQTTSVRVANKCSFAFRDLSFEDLPTLHHIAAGLTRLSSAEVVGAYLIEQLGTTDISNQRVISI